MTLLRAFFYLGPLVFGMGFMAPLIDQSMRALGWSPPLGLSPLAFGLVVGMILGSIATLRGRWI